MIKTVWIKKREKKNKLFEKKEARIPKNWCPYGP